MVILGKDNFYFRRIILPQLEASSGTKAVYSLWHGYLKRTDLAQFLDSHNIELLEIHTSGHAYVEDLKKLAHVLDPRFVVPIHTFHPEQYSRIYENIVQLDDGETYYL
jgi:ribonuclease J